METSTPITLFTQCEPSEARPELLPLMRRVVSYLQALDSEALRGILWTPLKVRNDKPEPKLKTANILLTSFTLSVRATNSFEPVVEVQIRPRSYFLPELLPAHVARELEDLFGAGVRP